MGDGGCESPAMPVRPQGLGLLDVEPSCAVRHGDEASTTRVLDTPERDAKSGEATVPPARPVLTSEASSTRGISALEGREDVKLFPGVEVRITSGVELEIVRPDAS